MRAHAHRTAAHSSEDDEGGGAVRTDQRLRRGQARSHSRRPKTSHGQPDQAQDRGHAIRGARTRPEAEDEPAQDPGQEPGEGSARGGPGPAATREPQGPPEAQPQQPPQDRGQIRLPEERHRAGPRHVPSRIAEERPGPRAAGVVVEPRQRLFGPEGVKGLRGFTPLLVVQGPGCHQSLE